MLSRDRENANVPSLLKRVVVKNVGVLKAFNTPAAPHFERLTSFYARNGRGKTTLSTILCSAGSGDSAAIYGRRTLGQDEFNPEITLVFEDVKNTRFHNGCWVNSTRHIDVFNGEFISNNVYTGETVDIIYDRNLFTIILGKDGVRLARQQEFFVGAAKRAATRLKDYEKALIEDIPNDLTHDEFFAFIPNQELDESIKDAERVLAGIAQFDRLAKLETLEELSVPVIDPRISEILGRTVAEIEASARDHLASHFRKFDLTKRGEEWLKFGLQHIRDDACPFCGKNDVDSEGLIEVYTKIFGEAYKTHFEDINATRSQIEQVFGADKRAVLAGAISTNSRRVLSWQDFYTVDANSIPDVEAAFRHLESAYSELRSLFETKRQSPLLAIEAAEVLHTVNASLNYVTEAFVKYNAAITKLSIAFDLRRSTPALTDKVARDVLENLYRRRRRHDVDVQGRINATLAAKRFDARAKKARTITQARLKEKNSEGAIHYYTKVNSYLRIFSAKFQISAIKNSMNANIGSVDYGLVVRGHQVSRGRGRDVRDKPTFMNTLSTGDKTTLAFAFFLADLDRQQPEELKNRIIVFDDPMSSHDTHRRGKTIDLLFDLSGRCAQLIIFSHDAEFLRRVHRRCNNVPRVTYEIKAEGREEWSQAHEADLDELCASEHEKRLRKLHNYYEFRVGQPTDVAPAIRPILETYFRATYPAYFRNDVNLGEMIIQIKRQGASHPCWRNCAHLDSCNVNTLDQHHGDDPKRPASEPIDPDDLYGMVRTCLILVHAIIIEENVAENLDVA